MAHRRSPLRLKAKCRLDQEIAAGMRAPADLATDQARVLEEDQMPLDCPAVQARPLAQALHRRAAPSRGVRVFRNGETDQAGGSARCELIYPLPSCPAPSYGASPSLPGVGRPPGQFGLCRSAEGHNLAFDICPISTCWPRFLSPEGRGFSFPHRRSRNRRKSGDSDQTERPHSLRPKPECLTIR